MSRIRPIQKYILIAITEVLVALILMAIAPHFLNSNNPTLGFVIVLGVPLILLVSGGVAIAKLIDARKARSLFVRHFPHYAYLTLFDFLDVPSAQVARQIELFETIQHEPDFQLLAISPLEFLLGAKRNER